uniref:Regulatory protein zeste n=1 Tax=Heliothis virescens TaxID=7102 RepID=A0A2A4IY09_HELVI
MASRKKNFNDMEKNLLLEILKGFKNVIENKKTDNMSTAQKKAAWARIAETFNASAIISESASGEQLRRLWQNLKTRQRDALTRERQHRMATGGGGPCPDAVVNVDIAEIAPALLVEISDTLDSNCDEFVTNQQMEPCFIVPDSQPDEQLNNSIPTQPVTETTNNQSMSTSEPNIYLELPSNEKKLRVHILQQEHLNRERRAAQLHEQQLKFMEEKHKIEIEILKQKLKEATSKAESAAHQK